LQLSGQSSHEHFLLLEKVGNITLGWFLVFKVTPSWVVQAKMADGSTLKIEKRPYLGNGLLIGAKFGTLTQIDPMNCIGCLKKLNF